MNLPEPAARALFTAAPSAVLATVGPDAVPHLVPVTFAAAPDADRLYFAVDAKPKRSLRLKRLDNIRLHSAVCLLADHYDSDWQQLWWVRADGVARILAEDVDDRAVPLSLLTARYPQYAQQPPQGPVVEIEVTRWTGWAFGPDALAAL